MHIKLSVFIHIFLFYQCISLANELILSKNSSKEDIYSYAIEMKPTFDELTLIVDDKKIEFNDTIKSKTIIDEMGFGYNLGNTFDASNSNQNQGLESETSWGAPKTTEEMIEGLTIKGIKSIRIPTTWHNHLIDKSYTISPEWMQRIKTVVDWAIDKGLYVILNCHHDNADYTKENITYGKGYYPLRKDAKESEKFLYNIWKQIAIAFNNGYDHHLIFETLNEPRLKGTEFEWKYKKGEPICEEAVSCLNEYNSLIVKTIRETGGNNEKRFIMVPALCAKFEHDLNLGFVFPSDTKYNPTNNKMLYSAHSYRPRLFAGDANMTFTKFENSYKNDLFSDFKYLYENFVLKGHHVVIGEMGCINKNNTDDRALWADFFVSTSRKFQLSCVLWDNANFDNTKGPKSVYGIYYRNNCTWANEKLIDAYIKASETELMDNPPDNFPMNKGIN